jgi:WD40 repeat protein
VAERLRSEDPERLGEYWLAGRLGAGGQGVVYEAYDGGGTRVAIKVLHGDAANNPELRQNLGREATAARRVASFCTARVIAAEFDGERPYIVSEYVEGPSLRHALQEGRGFGGDELHRLATAIATALTAIHEAGVIHRDLKPDNVLLGPDGPRLIDFGVARTMDMSLTTTGLVAGTPVYMAPEAFTGQRAGAPADVFAWGGIMLFAATGDDPFKADSLGAVMHRVLTMNPDLTVLPGSLRPLVGAALHKNPLGRPSSRELLLALVSGGGADGDAGLLAAGNQAARSMGQADAHDPSLGVLAEEAYGLLPKADQALLPDVLLRMVAAGPDGELSTRRVPEDELPAEAGMVLHVFSYMLSRRDGEIRLARPGLLRAWPRLRTWLAEERDGLAVHDGVRGQARQWAEHGRRDADLMQGSRLDAAVAWAAGTRRHLTLNPLERDFLDASTAFTRRRARRRRLLTLTLTVLLVLSLAGGGLAIYQGRQITEQRDNLALQRDRAKGRELAYLAGTMRTTAPATAMLLSVAGWRLESGAETQSEMVSSLYQPEIDAYRQPPEKQSAWRALGAGGRLLVSVAAGQVRLFDVRAKRLLKQVTVPELKDVDWLNDIALSPSGRLVAVETQEEVLVWDLTAGRELSRLPLPGTSFEGLLDFGDAETSLAVTYGLDERFVWDLTTDSTHGRELTPWKSGVRPVVSRSGRLAAVLAAGGAVDLWSIPGSAGTRAECPGKAIAAAFSPDESMLACAAEQVTIVDTRTGKRLLPAAAGVWPWSAENPTETGNALTVGLRFSPDGRFLLGYADRAIRVWRVADGKEFFAYRAEGEVTDARFDSSGRTLRYLLDDSVTTLDFRPVTSARAAGKIINADLSPDGRWMATLAEGAASTRVWDVRRRRFAGTLPAGTGGSGATTVFDAGGGTMVTGTGTSLRAWEVATLKPLWRARISKDRTVEGSAFSPDGKIFAASTVRVTDPNRPQLTLWDARNGRLIRNMPLGTFTGRIKFTPDGRMLATTTGRFIDATTGKQVGPAFGDSLSAATPFALSAAPRMLAAGSRTGRVALWDIRGPSPLPQVLHSETGHIAALAFSPKGDLLAITGHSGKVELWDVGSKRRLGEALQLASDSQAGLISLAFSHDGSALHVADQKGTVYDLPVTGEQVAAAVCARAGRTLSRQEWQTYLQDIPYHDMCRTV